MAGSVATDGVTDDWESSAEYRVHVGSEVRAKVRRLPSAQISKVVIVALLDALEERERIVEQLKARQ